jgi:hypothetical protein
VIRPFLPSTVETKAIPAELLPVEIIKAKGRDIKNFEFQTQCAP